MQPTVPLASIPSGGSALSDEGILVGSGATQLNDLSSYYNNMGLNTDGEFTEEVKTAKEQMDKEGLKESESMADEIESALKSNNIFHSRKTRASAWLTYIITLKATM